MSNVKALTMICTDCDGACCKKIGEVISIYKSLKLDLGYDFTVNDKGECSKLINGRCSIYKDRPDICNLEKSYNNYRELISEEDYMNMNKEHCKKFRDN